MIIISGLRATDLTHAVNFQNFNIKTHEIIQNFRAERGGRTEETVSKSKAKLILDFPINHLVGNLKRTKLDLYNKFNETKP